MGFTSPYGFCAYSLRLSSWPEAELLCDFAEGLPEYLSPPKHSTHSPLPVSWLFLLYSPILAQCFSSACDFVTAFALLSSKEGQILLL